LPLARSEEGRPALFEAVPNFSEGRDLDLVGRLGAGRHTLDVHADADHNRSVITLAAVSAEALIEDLLDKVESQVARVEHPQVWSSRVQKLRQERGMSPVKNEMPPRS